MQKLTIKTIAEFRSKGDKGKLGFVNRLNRPPKPKEPGAESGGGDYWITSISALNKSFRENDIRYATDKISELCDKRSKSIRKQTKDTYTRNIDILAQYTSSDLKRLRPVKDLEFPRTPKRKVLFVVKGFNVQVDISHIFTFNKDGFDQVGCTWFVAKKDGFSPAELGMFTSLMYRYLEAHFSTTHTINAQYCIAIDAFKKTEVTYAQLERKEIMDALEPTLDEIRLLLKTISRAGAIQLNPNQQHRPRVGPSAR
ncbi:MAG: hypothetical protein KJZ58_00520 [Flavobacteriales bacterium]|nr:hypothetical protein [Flavobacteriales bacterium]